MEDSFKVRVDRAFGSLEPSSSSSSIKSTSSSLTSLWSLTDQEIERNEWIQDKVTPHRNKDEEVQRLKNPKPYSSFLQGLLAQPSTSHQDLGSDIEELEEEEQQQQLCKPDDHSNEEWDIRSSVGMDCSLDNEEEEDGFDKVALGREDRFYMRDVNDYEVEIESNKELPNSISDVIRDPRANHMAAKLRLKEDDESARKLVAENGSKEEVIGQSVVPDYIRNPSKYTHYTFDDCMDDVDEESNRKAYMELFNLVKRSSEHEDSSSPSSIIFTPKKKSSMQQQQQQKEHMQKKVVPISIVEEEEVVSEMEEDEAAANKSSREKGGRRYRTKASGHME